METKVTRHVTKIGVIYTAEIRLGKYWCQSPTKPYFRCPWLCLAELTEGLLEYIKETSNVASR